MNGPESTILLMSTQEAIKGTVQYSTAFIHGVTTAESSCALATSRVAHRFGSGKLYICLSNKCFNSIQRICCVTDVRP